MFRSARVVVRPAVLAFLVAVLFAVAALFVVAHPMSGGDTPKGATPVAGDRGGSMD